MTSGTCTSSRFESMHDFIKRRNAAGLIMWFVWTELTRGEDLAENEK